jgi:hypothetical protein
VTLWWALHLAVEFGEILGRELDLGGVEVFLDPLEPAGSGIGTICGPWPRS